jgi:hypothetical protein
MSKVYHLKNASYKGRQMKGDWATNIEAIIRLTQRNLSGTLLITLKVLEIKMKCMKDIRRKYSLQESVLLWPIHLQTFLITINHIKNLKLYYVLKVEILYIALTFSMNEL